MKSELQKHKKSDAIKWIAIFTAVILLGVMVAAIMTKGFTDANPYGWFDKACSHEFVDGVCTKCGEKETPEAPITGGVTDENGNQLESGNVYPMPANMIFSSASAASETANNGVTITATVKPDIASDKSVDWAVSFANAESDWAVGKNATDYVMVTPVSDGSVTATVVCKAAFGEQILISCTSRQNSTVSVSVNVDYLKRIENLMVSSVYDGSSFGDNSSIIWSFGGSADSNNLILPVFKEIKPYIESSYQHFLDSKNPEITWGLGTITPTNFKFVTYRKYSDSFVTAINSQGEIFAANNDWEVVGRGDSYAYNLTPNGLISVRASNGDFVLFSAPSFSGFYIKALREANGNFGQGKVVVEYDGGLSYEMVFDIGISPSSLVLLVDSIELSETNLVF